MRLRGVYIKLGQVLSMRPDRVPADYIAALQKLQDKADVILCIYAGDIERRKVRADFGITYDSDALKTIDDLSEWGIEVSGVVITRYAHQPAATSFSVRARQARIRRLIRFLCTAFASFWLTEMPTRKLAVLFLA